MTPSGIHAGSDRRLRLAGCADRLGTVEIDYGRKWEREPRARRGRGRRVEVAEVRNGLPEPGRYVWRREGRITALTARIMAEIAASRTVSARNYPR